MKLKYAVFGSLCMISLFFIACNEPIQEKETTETRISDNGRPYSPWVFRSVLDNRPRMINLALHEELYASYSTETGGLYKVWKGDVLFEGAVYNSAHGPQPISLGDAYFINGSIDKPFIVRRNGEDVSYDLQYLGHRFFDGNQVELQYELRVGDEKIKIYENPDAVAKDDNISFSRNFTVKDLPSSYTIALAYNVSSLIIEDYITTDGKLNILNKKNRGSVLDINTEVELNTEGNTMISVLLTDKNLITNPNNELISEDELDANLGKELIGKNDCKSCHNTYVKTIGPAYTAIAEKYSNTDDNITYLVGKIIKGGSGVWGNVPMSAHPELSNEDATEMVKYIMSLDADQEKGKTDQEEEAIKPEFLDAQFTESEGLLPGALVKVYDIARSTDNMPNFLKMKPKMGGVLANFDNLDSRGFKDLEFNFGLLGEGYLEVDSDKEISFRVWSDDGSKLYINDRLIIDNDGNHGTQYKENKIGLKKGFHTFRLEYFQGGGGAYLSFNWKPEGNDAWEPVPLSAISHKTDRHKEITGLSLPMSDITSIPGDEQELTDVHPSFDMKQIRPNAFLPKVGGLDVLSDGRVILSTWDPQGAVYIVDYKDAYNPEDIQYKKIAEGLAEPLGVKVVGDDIYVMQKQEMTQLIDTDGDDIIDEYKVICNDWGVSSNFHEFGFGLEEKDDYLYATLAIGIMPGGASAKNQPEDRGKVIKVNRKTGEYEFVASGLRTPNGIGKGYNDEIFVADNQGDWLPSSKILHITQGAFFNSRAVDYEGTKNTPVKQPVVWLPQNDIGNSPSTPIRLDVGPYKNQMIHGEVTHGGLKRVFVEDINGQLQGALFRFSQGFEAGVNRISWADEKTLIVGGIGNPGNWQQYGKKWYGLQSFTYNGDATFEMLAVRAKTNGLEIEFTQALRPGDGNNPQSYFVEQWYYEPTAEYGGPKMGVQELKVLSANVSADRKKVFLEIPSIKKEHVVHLVLKEHFVSADNGELWSTEAWYTMNEIPKNNLGQAQNSKYVVSNNTLSDAEKAAGWKLLFNGEDSGGIRNFRKQSLGSSWKIKDGELFLDSQKKADGHWQAADGGDIVVTDQPYENYEFEVEWKISNCGNSGIIYNVIESDEYDYAWMTGPEMQILDNTCHPDTRFPTHRAGDLYDMIETKYSTVNPAGEWNKVRIVSKNGKIEHWQNGHKVVEYRNDNEEWKEMIAYSKFKDMPGFGSSSKGHIVLQDHGDPVYFRNIKIRPL